MRQEIENQLNSAQVSDVGCVRELNEDSIISLDNLWVVADGMGGHACGEVASALAIEQMKESFAKQFSLSDSIQVAHEKIIEAAKNNLAQSGMGTTIVALVNQSDGYQIAWVGDSRAYLWDGRVSKLCQLTEDHSLIVKLIKAGLISAEDAQTHPQRHMITQCLGSTEIPQVQVDTCEGEWHAKQKILLCSDGLTDEVSDQQIAQIMNEENSLDDQLAALIDAAKKSGGRDNVSIILVESPITSEQGWFSKIRNFLKL